VSEKVKEVIDSNDECKDEIVSVKKKWRSRKDWNIFVDVVWKFEMKYVTGKGLHSVIWNMIVVECKGERESVGKK
jgi:hypothetical protein